MPNYFESLIEKRGIKRKRRIVQCLKANEKEKRIWEDEEREREFEMFNDNSTPKRRQNVCGTEDRITFG